MPEESAPHATGARYSIDEFRGNACITASWRMVGYLSLPVFPSWLRCAERGQTHSAVHRLYAVPYTVKPIYVSIAQKTLPVFALCTKAANLEHLFNSQRQKETSIITSVSNYK